MRILQGEIGEWEGMVGRENNKANKQKHTYIKKKQS